MFSSLDFMTNPPTASSGVSSMTAPAGCSSISDPAGNLLFYTNGETIWDATNQVMANGGALQGNSQAYQSVIIVQRPGTTLYYVFCENGFASPAIGTFGLKYSIVDMSLAAGMGSVVAKDVVLDTTLSTQKLIATNHCNGRDIWVMTHDKDNTNFKAYLVTAASGLNPVPVVSSAGTSGIWSTAGEMKFSPNGKKIAYTASYNFHLFDFDNSTGTVFNFINLGAGYFLAEGCEFSPDGTKLYGTSNGVPGQSNVIHDLYQWDLCAGSTTAVIASKYTINSSSYLRGMQLAPDGKIYVSDLSGGLGVIQNPDSPGSACNYTTSQSYLMGVFSMMSLPNFNSGYFRQPNLTPSFSVGAMVNCASATFAPIQISPAIGCTNSGNFVTQASWNFGDPSTGAANTSTLLNPVHMYSGVGLHTVTAIFEHDCSIDTITQVLGIYSLQAPLLTVSGTQSVCYGAAVSLTASGANTYIWNNTFNGPSITETLYAPKVYTVVGTSTTSSCFSSSVFTVAVKYCTGLTDLTGNTINVFPNPAKSQIVFDFIPGETAFIDIYNQLGQKVLTQKSYLSGETLDISELREGYYFYTLRTHGNSLVGKFIVAKD